MGFTFYQAISLFLKYEGIWPIPSNPAFKEDETRQFIENAFCDGEIKIIGTDIDGLMPAVSRFGGGNRDIKKKNVIDKLNSFFEKFFGISASFVADKPKSISEAESFYVKPLDMVADNSTAYGGNNAF